MIVACRRSQKRLQPKKLYSIYEAKGSAMVLAAACFRNGKKGKAGLGFSYVDGSCADLPKDASRSGQLATLGNR